MSEDPAGRSALAIGSSREAAAEAFGSIYGQLTLTTYADAGPAAGWLGVGVVALADDPAAETVLAEVLAAGRTTHVVVELPAQPERRGRLVDLLRANQHVGIVGVTHQSAGPMTITLGPAGDEAVCGEAIRDLVETLPPAGADALTSARSTGTDASRTRAHVRAARTPRPKLVAAGFAALGALGLAVALVWAVSGAADADRVLASVVAGVAVLQALVVVGILYLVRNVRRARQEDRRFRERLLSRTQRLVKQGVAARQRSAAQGKRLAALDALGRESVLDGRRLALAGQRQTQALLNLHDLVRVDAAVPPAGGWAASPDLLLYCVDLLLAERPSLVVETGSGLTTLYLSLAARQYGLETRIVSLEHDSRYAQATRALLDRHGVGDRAEVRLAPLEPSSVPGHETPWYAESALAGLDDIGVLLIDGPPTATGPQARYPAVPLLRDRLAERCTIVMDDLNRAADRETADSWSELLPDFDYTVVREFEKHAGILRRG